MKFSCSKRFTSTIHGAGTKKKGAVSADQNNNNDNFVSLQGALWYVLYKYMKHRKSYRYAQTPFQNYSLLIYTLICARAPPTHQSQRLFPSTHNCPAIGSSGINLAQSSSPSSRSERFSRLPGLSFGTLATVLLHRG